MGGERSGARPRGVNTNDGLGAGCPAPLPACSAPGGEGKLGGAEIQQRHAMKHLRAVEGGGHGGGTESGPGSSQPECVAVPHTRVCQVLMGLALQA